MDGFTNAVFLFNRERFEDALPIFLQVLAEDPQNERCFGFIALCYSALGKQNEAIEFIEEGIRANPVSAPIQFIASTFYRQIEELERAERLNRQAIALCTTDADYYGSLALILEKQGKFEAAEQTATIGLSVDPKNVCSLQSRSKARFSQGYTTGAMADLRTAAEIDPTNAALFETMGWQALESGEHEEAKRIYRHALSLNPESIYAKEGYGEAIKREVAVYRALVAAQRSIGLLRKTWWIIFIICLLLFNLLYNKEGNPVVHSKLLGFGGFWLVFILLYPLFQLKKISDLFLSYDINGQHIVTKKEKVEGFYATGILMVMIFGLLIYLV